ncbi:MAG: type II secretion system GspH family protein [Candidatus Margulisbacteria bacterium]|nr:type II secretion system GspH family protein [Candidatus Margulisiibacteriota bacterium]MBU1616380.1 type II secretion system GspH family protein [Candidatus Margulisiibacteriota bacterium]
MYIGRKGFSLIELTMVIVILGILAVSVLPRFINFNKQAELGVARHFAGVLKEAEDIYYTRLILDNIDQYELAQRYFLSFVAFSEGVSDRNTLAIDNGIRNLLQNPGGEVLQPDNSIKLTFKSGAVANYYLSPTTGAITAEYVGF